MLGKIDEFVGMGLGGNCRDLIQTLPRHLPVGMKNTKSEDSVPPEIRTGTLAILTRFFGFLLSSTKHISDYYYY
jgi:hypothetical protein